MRRGNAGDARGGKPLDAGGPPDPEPLDPDKQPPIDRYCDLVLTGGVTDGVVYPWAIIELARTYRFKNIGGTSVGAMAAALTAAAEYSRRHGSLTGFNQVLLKLPRKLGEDVGGGKTRIFSLFQPAKETQRLFDVFVSLFSPEKGARHRSFAYRFLPVLRAYRCPALIGLAAGALAGYFIAANDWIEFLFVALPYALLFALLLVGIAVYFDLVHGLVRNGFGLCKGGRVDAAKKDALPSLIEWLYDGIQGAAGKPYDQPLTFEDLWNAPGGPGGSPMPPALPAKKPRSIDLRMVTTNLTHGRPYGLPLDDPTSRLFFKAEELKRFFPEPVLEHLKRTSKRYRPARAEDPRRAPDDIRELPLGELPVIVAARMSLSFPFLFSNVPLYAIDYEPKRKKRRLRRCQFSDGGICSNFPIHLFDAAVPKWPTFGISLGTRSIFRKDAVWLPGLHYQGRGDSWNRFGDEHSARSHATIPPSERLFGFLKSVVWAAKDWNDQTTARMPGVRDRVVHVFLKEDQGGLNLKLSSEDILQLAAVYGQPAGKALVDKFAVRRQGAAWSEHRWMRFNTFLTALRERVEALTAAAERQPYCEPLSGQIAQARTTPPLAEDPPASALTAAQANDLKELLAALEVLESNFAHTILQPYKPAPQPSLHLRPPF
jgi:predicted acylesterase/phospholipase RssA